MKTIITEDLYQYALEIAPEEPQILQQLRIETSKLPGSQMQITVDQGQFMVMLARILGVKKYLEIGIFTGYSSLAVTLATDDNAITYALDNDPQILQIAAKYWQQANIGNKIIAMCDDALTSLAKLCQDGHSNTFDLAFIDAKKADYKQYYEYCYTLVRNEGVILVDNVFMQGRVLLPNPKGPIQSIIDFNQYIRTDPRVDICVTTIADGLTIIRKRGK